jgi:regulator of ribosome biosynthesis
LNGSDRVFECPIEKSEVGPLAVLPNEVTVLPREKRIPEPKPETKWERFAREKGIKKRKKDRMVWDEDNQEFRPSFGYKRAKGGVEDLPIVEVKAGQDPYADPWAVARKEKKERVNKNLQNQVKNKMRAAGMKVGRKIKYGKLRDRLFIATLYAANLSLLLLASLSIPLN